MLCCSKGSEYRYSVYHSFKLTFSKNSKIILFVSLLPNFNMSNIFRGNSVITPNRIEPKPNLHRQEKLVQIPDTHGFCVCTSPPPALDSELV